MAVDSSDEALAELTAFAGAEIDDAWLMRAFSLRSSKSQSSEESIVRLRIFRRLESVVQAMRLDETQRFATEMADDQRCGSFLSCADLELAVANGISPRAAANRIITAQQLSKLPTTLEKLQQGRITEWHVVSLLKLSDLAHPNGSDDDPDYGLNLLAKCEAEIYDGMTDEPLVQQLRSKARRTMLRADPTAFSRAHEKAAETQDVELLRDEFKGMAWVTAYMSLVDAETLMAAVRSHAAAARIGGDDRNVGELRVAALVDWAEQFMTGGNAPRAHGRPVELGVTASLETVLGLSDAPGEIAGVGLIPASVIRELATDARIRLLTIDGDTGRLLDCGRKTYRPPADLTRAVMTANPISLGPFTDRPARDCDLDHTQPWDDDGPTNYDNLRPLDRHVHRAKTLGGWHYEIDDTTGDIMWTSRLGQRIHVNQFDYCIPDWQLDSVLTPELLAELIDADP